MKHFLLILTLSLAANFTFAQKPFVNYFDTAFNIQSKNPENYIAPIKALIKLKPDTTDQYYNFWCQAIMTSYSFIGDYRKSIYYYDQAFNRNNDKAGYDTSFVRQHKFVDAATYIISKVSNHQIVMINEAHYLSLNRAFVISMLKRFYTAGYRYMPIETLQYNAFKNNQTYPNYNTGVYTREPLFGEMIREAKKLGFKLIAYEDTTSCEDKGKDRYYCNRRRDSIMAVNIAAIFKTDPKAKVLVYAGHDHIHEGSNNGWKKMAQFFKEMTGIDPLTIETTQQVDHFGLRQKEFAAVNETTKISNPVVALENNKPWHSDFVDITVIFPEYLKENGRPSYLSLNGRRKFCKLNSLKTKPGQLVQAFYARETPGIRIPADQFIFENQKDGLYLFKGKYELEIKDENGNLLKSTRIEVK